MKFWKVVLGTVTLVLSTNINAALIDNGVFTTDTETGLDWLDLTESTELSFEYVSTQFEVGGQFEGWTYASTNQVEGLFNSAGGASHIMQTSLNREPALLLMGLWGTIYQDLEVTAAEFITGTSFDDGRVWRGVVAHDNNGADADLGFMSAEYQITEETLVYQDTGHALVRVSAVPVPAAIWLFSSGLISLIVFTKRKKA